MLLAYKVSQHPAHIQEYLSAEAIRQQFRCSRNLFKKQNKNQK